MVQAADANPNSSFLAVGIVYHNMKTGDENGIRLILALAQVSRGPTEIVKRNVSFPSFLISGLEPQRQLMFVNILLLSFIHYIKFDLNLNHTF